jgi:hypothetical protein
MLYTYDPKTQASSVVCEAPEDEGFEDVAADPKTGDILITGFVKPGHEDRLGWYYLAGEKQLLLVTARRIDQMVSPTFSPEGLLLFGVHGDLWAGRISLVDPENQEPLGLAFVEAVRLAPLANLDTGNFQPAAQRLRGVTVAGDSIFAICDQGGTGDGGLVRLPRPSAPLKNLNNFPASIAMFGHLLSGAKVIEESSFQRMPCSSPSGDRIFFGRGGSQLVILRVADGSVEVIAEAP